jgi:hypothetical protein
MSGLPDVANRSIKVYIQSNIGLMTQAQYIMMLESCYVVWIGMALLGVVSNIINIRVFILMGLHDGVTVSFLALAIFDLTYLISSISLSVSVAFYVFELKLVARFCIDPFAIFVFSATVMIIISITNVLTTTFLAVVRCLCVAKPLQFKNTMTKSKATIWMTGIGIFSFAIYIPILANMGMIGKFDKFRNSTRLTLWMSSKREIAKNNVWMVTEMFLPIVTQLVIMICIVIMVRCLRTAYKFRQSSGSACVLEDIGNKKQNCDQKKPGASDSSISNDKLSGKDLRVVQQVVLISVVYLVCNVPKILISFCTAIEPEFTVGRRYSNVYMSANCLRKHFEIVNATVNFLIYYKYNSKFRSILSK